MIKKILTILHLYKLCESHYKAENLFRSLFFFLIYLILTGSGQGDLNRIEKRTRHICLIDLTSIGKSLQSENVFQEMRMFSKEIENVDFV